MSILTNSIIGFPGEIRKVNDKYYRTFTMKKVGGEQPYSVSSLGNGDHLLRDLTINVEITFECDIHGNLTTYFNEKENMLETFIATFSQTSNARNDSYSLHGNFCNMLEICSETSRNMSAKVFAHSGHGGEVLALAKHHNIFPSFTEINGNVEMLYWIAKNKKILMLLKYFDDEHVTIYETTGENSYLETALSGESSCSSEMSSQHNVQYVKLCCIFSNGVVVNCEGFENDDSYGSGGIIDFLHTRFSEWVGFPTFIMKLYNYVKHIEEPSKIKDTLELELIVLGVYTF